MAAKIKYNRPELKRYRAALARYERYIPMLKLKQRQLQLAITEVQQRLSDTRAAEHDARRRFEEYASVLADLSGVNIRGLAAPAHIHYEQMNVGGVKLQALREVEFAPITYSLFGTAPWTDFVLAGLREISRIETEAKVLSEQHRVLSRELHKIIQRVNLFEKVKVPEAREAIRRIRIHLGDAMAASVGRARIAKSKLAASETNGEAAL